MKYVRMLGTGLLYFCVATVLAQAVVLAMLWWKGALSDDRLVAMIAALHGIHPQQAENPRAAIANREHSAEQPSLDEIAKKRLLAGLDMSLRETTLDKSLVDLRLLEQQIAKEKDRLQQWQDGMDKRIAEAVNTSLDNSLQELQQTLMALSPKQAKEQILKMLESSATGAGAGDDRAMSDVVRILKAMPLDKRKKILGEFKSAPESEKLAEILSEIRRSPELDVLRDSRNQPEGSKR